MKISTRARYGMVFMVDLAQHYGEGPMPMKEIAERENISKKYLEQVVTPLSKAKLLNVTRGHKGGFELSRDPGDITLAEVVAASEDGLALLDCLSCISLCDNEGGCVSRNVWGGMQRAIIDYLRGRTLADVCNSLSTDSEPGCQAL
jgi:Rrf2 family protein